MSDIERAVQDLVSATIESEGDIEQMVKTEVRECLERELSDCLDSENVVRANDLDALRSELLRAIEVRTVRHQAAAVKAKFKNTLAKLFTGRVKNGSRCQLWTLIF